MAIFSTLSVNKAAAGYTLTAASGVLSTGATSSSFQISAAAAHHLVFAGQPTSSVAGQAISPAVSVQVLDAFDNLVPDAATTITVAIYARCSGPARSSPT